MAQGWLAWGSQIAFALRSSSASAKPAKRCNRACWTISRAEGEFSGSCPVVGDGVAECWMGRRGRRTRQYRGFRGTARSDRKWAPKQQSQWETVRMGVGIFPLSYVAAVEAGCKRKSRGEWPLRSGDMQLSPDHRIYYCQISSSIDKARVV